MEGETLYLDRFSYADTETEGVLSVSDIELATIELPWIPWMNEGGKPYESCIPDGTYRLEPFVRPSGEEAYILINPVLGVHRFRDDRPNDTGRFLCLFHRANWTTDVVGCVAVGLRRTLMKNPATGKTERAVASSSDAMELLINVLGRLDTHTLIVGPKLGTV